jgi:hypothetical protein
MHYCDLLSPFRSQLPPVPTLLSLLAPPSPLLPAGLSSGYISSACKGSPYRYHTLMSYFCFGCNTPNKHNISKISARTTLRHVCSVGLHTFYPRSFVITFCVQKQTTKDHMGHISEDGEDSKYV